MGQIIEVPVQRSPRRVFHSGFLPDAEVWIQPPLARCQATYDASRTDLLAAVAEVADQGLGIGGSGWTMIEDETGALLLRSSSSTGNDLPLELTSGSEGETALSVQTRSDTVMGLFLSLIRRLDLLLPRQV